MKMRKEIVYKIQIEIQNKNYNERLKNKATNRKPISIPQEKTKVKR